MPRALQMITQENGGKNVPVYMHPQMFGLRAFKQKDGSFFQQEKVPGVDVLTGNGGDVVVTRDEQLVLGETFFISGEIPRVTPFERGLPGQHRQKDGRQLGEGRDPAGRALRLGPCRRQGPGRVHRLLPCRAGQRAARGASALSGRAALRRDGGFHLAGANEAIIPETVEALAPLGLKLIAAGHCTGWRAVNALAARFGTAVVPSAVGKRYVL